MSDFLCIGLSPALQKTLLFDSFEYGEVNRSTAYYSDAAGKCINSCRVLVQAGSSAECLTVGGRENRQVLVDLCRRDGITLHAAETAGRVRSCTTIVDFKAGSCTELVVNEPEKISSDEEDAFWALFEELLDRGFKSVLISGSRLPGFSGALIPAMVKAVKKKGMMLTADYKGEDLLNSFLSESIRPDCVKINESEFLETFSEFNDLETGLKEMTRRYTSNFVISRGAESTLAATDTGIREIPSKRLKALNPIGCGDSMTAGVAKGLAEGMELFDAAVLGRDYAARNALSIHPGWIREED